MAILCDEVKLCFVMAPRTACTAIGEVLRHELRGRFIPNEDIIDGNGSRIISSKHSTLRQLVDHGFIHAEASPALFKFTCVRNPFDSLVSLYVKKREKYRVLLDDQESWVHRVAGYVEDMKFCQEHSFEEWIDRKYGQGPLKRLLCPKQRSLSSKYTDGMNFVMRYERLQDDFDEALRRAGVGMTLAIPQINKTTEKKGHYRDYYTTKARRVVERAFAGELQQYGYSF